MEPGQPAHRVRAVLGAEGLVREFLQPPSFFEALGVRYVMVTTEAAIHVTGMPCGPKKHSLMV